jgi:Ca2+/H+ antiporter, TMEM165/GDT1 family
LRAATLLEVACPCGKNCILLVILHYVVTMQLATHKNAIGVAVGASLGHTLCTSLAVVGGSMLASKISQRTVATIGGVLFLGFSVSSYFYPPL